MTARQIGQGKPLICTPLVGNTEETVLIQLAQVLAKKPDIIEWRADFYQDIADTDKVIALGGQIKKAAGEFPVIFTIRSAREGGQSISLTDRQAIELDAEICKQTDIEYVDCELSHQPEDIAFLRDIAHNNNAKIIGSFHNFHATPSLDELAGKFSQARDLKLDVAKVAVMPQNKQDVLTLLQATLEAKSRLDIPLITMSMGKYGAISRMIGGIFGSSLSFAVGAQASAPGQIPIEDLHIIFDILERTIGE